ncbi:hypothetical protein [Streptomyces sp. NPDC091371]|uniref:hypothetical protein n=1 Tax=Streptomyces sp. NPDC091371 TaxID=3155303 RepID=UPI003445B167
MERRRQLADGDNTIDVDLPWFGAGPHHKDAFLELDYSTGQAPRRDDIQATERSAEAPPLEQLYAWRLWPERVTAPVNDGVEVFALPNRLTRALARASSAELGELAARWTTRLWSEDGDDMTDDDLLAVLQGIARLAESAVNAGGGLYSWSL